MRNLAVAASVVALGAIGLAAPAQAAPDEPRRGTAGSRVNFVHPKDAGGVLVELVEPAGSGDGPV